MYSHARSRTCLCAWCCVIFAATSRCIKQYCVQLQRHASTYVHARERTITYADVRPCAWSYVCVCVCVCVRARVGLYASARPLVRSVRHKYRTSTTELLRLEPLVSGEVKVYHSMSLLPFDACLPVKSHRLIFLPFPTTAPA